MPPTWNDGMLAVELNCHKMKGNNRHDFNFLNLTNFLYVRVADMKYRKI